MSILVVGSVGLDSVTSPEGECRDALGGSAVYFSIAASFFTKVNLVGVVGDDFPDKYRNLLETRDINLDGLEVVPGKTFRWTGSYLENLNEAKTISTYLNVFGDFSPKLPRSCRTAETVFLANISPKLQLNVLSQVPERKIVALDTMNYWINNEKESLLTLLPACDIFLLNEGEALQLTGKTDYRSAARSLRAFGPRHVILKRGEYGSLLISNGELLSAPAYLIDKVVDPTGAGDSFAGGVLGYLDSLTNDADSGGEAQEAKRMLSYKYSGKHHFLAEARSRSRPLGLSSFRIGMELTRAMFYGAAVASFCVENFSVGGLLAATREDIENRVRNLAGAASALTLQE